MLSRRRFILAGLGLSLLPNLYFTNRPAHARKRFVRQLAQVNWPSLIAADRILVLKKNVIALLDRFGNLSIVSAGKNRPLKLISKLDKFSGEIIDLAVSGNLLFVVSKQLSDTSRTELVVTDLRSYKSPRTIARGPLPESFSPGLVAAKGGLITVSGTVDTPLVLLYSLGGRKGALNPESQLEFKNPVQEIVLCSDLLVAIHQSREDNFEISLYGIRDPSSPLELKTLKLSGNPEHAAACDKSMFVVCRNSEAKGPELKSITLNGAPHVVDHANIRLPAVSQIIAEDDQVVLVGNETGRPVVETHFFDNTLSFGASNSYRLEDTGTIASARAFKNLLYLASSRGVIYCLKRNGRTWEEVSKDTCRRLPASSVTCWQKSVILAGRNLKIYDISKPKRPVLRETVSLNGSVKAVFSIGSHLLAMTRDQIGLRKMPNLSGPIADLKISGSALACDRHNQKAYVLESSGRESFVTPVKLYSDKLVAESRFQVGESYQKIQAFNGTILLAGLRELALYTMSDSPKKTASTSLDELAIRDIYLTEGYLYLTAVDHASQGYLLIASTADLAKVGQTALPHTGSQLAVEGNTVVAVGETGDGKALVTFVNVRSKASPRIISSEAAVSDVAAVCISGELAIAAGSGLQILKFG